MAKTHQIFDTNNNLIAEADNAGLAKFFADNPGMTVTVKDKPVDQDGVKADAPAPTAQGLTIAQRVAAADAASQGSNAARDAIIAGNKLAAEGTDADTLKLLQANMTADESVGVQPSKSTGQSTIVSLDTPELTARLLELERRFNNLNMAEHAQTY